MEHFTPVASALGGLLIGLAASLLLLGLGRIAGVSGILGGLLNRNTSDRGWRLAFVLGLVLGGVVMLKSQPALFGAAPPSLLLVGGAGLLVGFGTRMSNGCTSGHGVCGLSRLSPRSLIATLIFMATGALTVFVGQHLLGGGR